MRREHRRRSSSPLSSVGIPLGGVALVGLAAAALWIAAPGDLGQRSAVPAAPEIPELQVQPVPVIERPDPVWEPPELEPLRPRERKRTPLVAERIARLRLPSAAPATPKLTPLPAEPDPGPAVDGRRFEARPVVADPDPLIAQLLERPRSVSAPEAGTSAPPEETPVVTTSASKPEPMSETSVPTDEPTKRPTHSNDPVAAGIPVVAPQGFEVADESQPDYGLPLPDLEEITDEPTDPILTLQPDEVSNIPPVVSLPWWEPPAIEETYPAPAPAEREVPSKSVRELVRKLRDRLGGAGTALRTVPEPGPLALLGLGLVILAQRRRRATR